MIHEAIKAKLAALDAGHGLGLSQSTPMFKPIIDEAPITQRLATANDYLFGHISRLSVVLDRVRGLQPLTVGGGAVSSDPATLNMPLNRLAEQYASLCGSLSTLVDELDKRI